MVSGSELARHLNHTDHFQCFAIQHDDAFAAADAKVPLPAVRRQREIARERHVRHDQLLKEPAVVREHLQSAVLAVGDIDHAVVRDANGVHDVVNGEAPALVILLHVQRHGGKRMLPPLGCASLRYVARLGVSMHHTISRMQDGTRRAR